MCSKFFKNYFLIKYFYIFLKYQNRDAVKCIYYRSLPIFKITTRQHFFIHRGHMFVYRYVHMLHKKKTFGMLALTRKLLNKPIKKNK